MKNNNNKKIIFRIKVVVIFYKNKNSRANNNIKWLIVVKIFSVYYHIMKINKKNGFRKIRKNCWKIIKRKMAHTSEAAARLFRKF